jgi:hypothetical protein
MSYVVEALKTGLPEGLYEPRELTLVADAPLRAGAASGGGRQERRGENTV